MIRFRCARCGKKLKAEEEIIGRKVKCVKCGRVEKVPPSDRLEKVVVAESFELDSGNLDEESSSRLEINPPLKTTRNVSADPPHEDFEIASESFSETVIQEKKEPESNRRTYSKPSSPSIRSLLQIGLGVLALVGLVLFIWNFNNIFRTERQFDPEFEKLGVVDNYRKAVFGLEKSGRVMSVMGRAYVSVKSTPAEVSQEIEQWEASIRTLTRGADGSKSPPALIAAADLFEQGNKKAAREELIAATKVLKAKRVEVDQQAKEYERLSK